jgi:caffeoyl-CoA O-methyltransferase
MGTTAAEPALGYPQQTSGRIVLMLGSREREEIERLWARKRAQDAAGVPQAERHRNLEPVSAEFLCALAAGIGAKKVIEIGGSSGISTIALAAAARDTGGRVTSIEIEPTRQAEARVTLARLELAPYVDFVAGDAASFLPRAAPVDLAFIDCDKQDYIPFFDMLRINPGGVVVADNILSHSMTYYVGHVRSRSNLESVTLPIGQGLEVTRFTVAQPLK